jgi:hypothetical protein
VVLVHGKADYPERMKEQRDRKKGKKKQSDKTKMKGRKKNNT